MILMLLTAFDNNVLVKLLHISFCLQDRDSIYNAYLLKIVSVRMTSSNNISEIKPFSITVHFFEWNLNEMPGVLKQKIDSSIKMIKTWPGSSKKYQQIKLLIWQGVLWWWHRHSMCLLFYILHISKLFKWYC